MAVLQFCVSVIQTPCGQRPCGELQSHTADSLGNSAQIICSHSWIVSGFEGSCAYTSIQRMQEELCVPE